MSTETSVAGLRDDFMRRWFAIAISVGFAATVVDMDWVKNGTWPDLAQQEQLARLFVALVATILSWEGYLLSIKKKPLDDLIRYFTDILLVFLYLFLLLTSRFEHFWLNIHSLIFGIYILWDVCTIALYPEKYFLKRGYIKNRTIWEKIRIVVMAYVGSIGSPSRVDRGPFITIYWAAYFAMLCIMPAPSSVNYTFWLASAVFAGLIMYRFDKQAWRQNPYKGPIIVVCLLAIGFLADLIL